MGVSGRPTRAWALSTDSEMPPCSDQPKDNNAAHVKAEAARAVFRACFMGFLRCATNINVARVPTSSSQIEFRPFSGNVDNVHVTADARHRVQRVKLRSPSAQSGGPLCPQERTSSGEP